MIVHRKGKCEFRYAFNGIVKMNVDVTCMKPARWALNTQEQLKELQEQQEVRIVDHRETP